MRPAQRWRRAAGSIMVAGGLLLWGGLAAAQEPVPTPVPPSPPSPAMPAAPGVPDVPAEAPAPAPGAGVPGLPAVPTTPREAALEDRVRQLESMVQKLADQVKAVPAAPKAGTPDYPATDDQGRPIPGAGPPVTGGSNTPAGGSGPNVTYRNSSGALAPGQGTPSNPPPSARFNMPAPSPSFPGTWRFGPGFEFRTPDDEFVLQFHNLTQVDYRGYEQGGQTPVHDTFTIPRQWFMFSGRLSKPYEYFLSIQNVIDTVNMLDVFLNIHYDDRLQFKIGRFKTPFTYEFYALPIQGLINSERSLFFNNFALNREIGAQAWGQLFDRSLDWAAGVFNANRNGYVDTQDGKAFLGFVNWRPFKDWEDSPLETLNIGGSVMAANGISTTAVPTTLRTQVATTGNATLGIPFLTFNNNTREVGDRALWDLHAAYYYKQLSLVGEWQSGYQTYALSSNLQQRTRVPIDSFYVQGGYFITGETVSGRNVVKPLKNFDLRPGYRGPGAVELTARYNYLTIGNQVFSGGFSDPNQYARNLYLTDVGANWYWTQQLKWLFTWEHAGFGQPVIFAPNRFQKTSDTFWARLQVYF